MNILTQISSLRPRYQILQPAKQQIQINFTSHTIHIRSSTSRSLNYQMFPCFVSSFSFFNPSSFFKEKKINHIFDIRPGLTH